MKVFDGGCPVKKLFQIEKQNTNRTGSKHFKTIKELN